MKIYVKMECLSSNYFQHRIESKIEVLPLIHLGDVLGIVVVTDDKQFITCDYYQQEVVKLQTYNAWTFSISNHYAVRGKGGNIIDRDALLIGLDVEPFTIDFLNDPRCAYPDEYKKLIRTYIVNLK